MTVQIAKLVMGPKGTPVQLTIKRNDAVAQISILRGTTTGGTKAVHVEAQSETPVKAVAAKVEKDLSRRHSKDELVAMNIMKGLCRWSLLMQQMALLTCKRSKRSSRSIMLKMLSRKALSTARPKTSWSRRTL